MHQMRIGAQGLNPLEDGEYFLGANGLVLGGFEYRGFCIPGQELRLKIRYDHSFRDQGGHQFVVFSIQLQLAHPRDQFLDEGLKGSA